jgi:hypothetical protein
MPSGYGDGTRLKSSTAKIANTSRRIRAKPLVLACNGIVLAALFAAQMAGGFDPLLANLPSRNGRVVSSLVSVRKRGNRSVYKSMFWVGSGV